MFYQVKGLESQAATTLQVSVMATDIQAVGSFLQVMAVLCSCRDLLRSAQEVGSRCRERRLDREFPHCGLPSGAGRLHAHVPNHMAVPPAEAGGLGSAGGGRAAGFHDLTRRSSLWCGLPTSGEAPIARFQVGQAVLSGVRAGVVRALDPQPVGEQVEESLLSLLIVPLVGQQPAKSKPDEQRFGVVGALDPGHVGEHFAVQALGLGVLAQVHAGSCYPDVQARHCWVVGTQACSLLQRRLGEFLRRGVGTGPRQGVDQRLGGVRERRQVGIGELAGQVVVGRPHMRCQLQPCGPVPGRSRRSRAVAAASEVLAGTIADKLRTVAGEPEIGGERVPVVLAREPGGMLATRSRDHIPEPGQQQLRRLAGQHRPALIVRAEVAVGRSPAKALNGLTIANRLGA